MYFSMGAHPAFHCEMGDRIVMDEPESSGAYRIRAIGSRTAEKDPVFANSREVVIEPHSFDLDALIFDDLRSDGATLVRANGRNVHVGFGGAPCLGIWAKPGAPFVCIEPWYGIDDRNDAGHDFTRKEQIRTLEPGEEFVFPVTVRAV